MRSETLKQQQQMKSEWQRQMQAQMKALKDQLQKMQDLHVALRRDSEI
jgi:hypothetical protein